MAATNTQIFRRRKLIKFEYIILLLLFLPIISGNNITMKFKGTGEELLFMNPTEDRPCPKSITVDGVIIPKSTCSYKFPNKIVTIKINLEKNIKSFQRMFSDISNIIEVDLTQYDTSLVENMAYMFENCASLRFANLSNLDISSIITMEKMFSNCLSLKDHDLTKLKYLKFLIIKIFSLIVFN